MNRFVVVIGGNGFIGYSVLAELVKRRISVRCLDIVRPDDTFRFKDVDYYIGDIWNSGFLQKALTGADCVMDFVSTSMPNTSDVSLSHEIGNTLRYHDYILSTMALCDVKHYVFPSSGGAIYGNKPTGYAYESDILKPTTPYGVGKQMSEAIIQYYFNKCGIAARVLRIGNVYGSPRLRSKAQGVIDVFSQNALCGEKITIWGNAKTAIRDYIYIGDVAKAIVDVYQTGFDDYNVYNIGSGIGTCLIDIIELIEKNIGKQIQIEHMDAMASGINSIVLSNEKIKSEVGWEPTVSLDEGIRMTIDLKRQLLEK